MNQSHFRWTVVVCGLLVLSLTGCSTLTSGKDAKRNKKDSSWSFFKKKEYQLPQSMNVTWTYDIFTKEGKPPTRGFGGRLYFYNERSQAIPVDGELTVFGFDDTDRSHDGSSMELADKKFRFTAEQFTTHFSESQLGASYSIWIPWDAAPGTRKKIMLIPTFKTSDGRVIRGNAATVLLPGVIPEINEQPVIQASAGTGVQQASFSSSPSDPASAGRTTTIQYPARGYSAKPVLSAEKAQELLLQIQDSQAKPMVTPLPTADSNEPLSSMPSSSVSTAVLPASQVGTPLPSFHIPMASGSMVGVGSQATGGSGLPGFAQATIAKPSAHSESSSHPVPVATGAPSFAYPTR